VQSHGPDPRIRRGRGRIGTSDLRATKRHETHATAHATIRDANDIPAASPAPKPRHWLSLTYFEVNMFYSFSRAARVCVIARRMPSPPDERMAFATSRASCSG
jgi:hypothetical protein